MRISIVGGGIGGLTAALQFIQGGHQVTVFERAPSLSEVGAGITLWPNATRVLDATGLGPAVRASGRVNQDVCIGTAGGRVLSRPWKDVDRPVGPLELIGIHRARLQQLLHDALPAGTVRFGWLCTGLDQSPDEVTLRFTNRPRHASEVVVGADGIHSTVRRELLDDAPARYAGYTAYRGLLRPSVTQTTVSGEFWGRGQRFGLVPIGGGELYWFATANQGAGEIVAADERKAHLLARFGDWEFGIPEVLESTPAEAILQNDILDRPPVRGWSKGRVVLIGDAAHPTTPNMGQGAAMAIEDAPILLRCIDREPELRGALELFEKTRAPRTSRITKISRRIGAIGQWSNPAACGLRNSLAAATPASLQRRFSESVSSYDATAA